MIATHMGAWAGGSDSSGYLNNARLLRAGHIIEQQREIAGLKYPNMPEYSYIPLGFVPFAAGHMVPTYPLGLSVLMLAVAPFTGWPLAPHVTMWLHTMLGVFLMYQLGRVFGFSRRSSAFGALLLGVCPLYLFMSVQAMSDTPAVVWCMAAVLTAWLSRRHWAWALASGVSVAIAVLVRPSDLLIMLPVAICLGFSWRQWLALIVGGAPGAVFLALFNRALYGQALTTGYGAVGGIFQLEYAPPALLNYIKWLPVLLTPGLVLIFALPWLIRRETVRAGAVLISWILVLLGFYVFYYHTHETWWYLRFILPAFPALILGILWAARAIAARRPQFGSPGVPAALALLVAAWSSYWVDNLNALDSGRGEKVYPDTARWARAHLPPNAVVLSMQMSGALLYYTNLTFLRWDQFDPPAFAPVEKFCVAAGRPIYAVLFPFEEKDVLEKRLPGHWSQVGAISQVTVWRRDEPASVSAAR